MKKTICMVAAMSVLIAAAWPPVAWPGQEIDSKNSRNQGLSLAQKEITTHAPQVFVIEERDIPEASEKSWFSRNKWYLLGGLAIAAGGAAAAAAGGGSGSNGGGGSGGEDSSSSDATVSW